MKKLITLFVLLGFIVNHAFATKYQQIQIVGKSTLGPGESLSVLGYTNMNATPENIMQANWTYEIIDPIYFPNYNVFELFAGKAVVSSNLDIEIRVKVTCEFDNLTDTKTVRLVPQKNNDHTDKYVILFIHGLMGSINSFDAIKAAFINDRNCYHAGEIDYLTGSTTHKPKQSNKLPAYTMAFSDPQDLTFEEQGKEVNRAVAFIQSRWPQRKIILMAHSMGGLAARAYLKDYGEDKVAGLITLVSPHAGSTFADFATDGKAIQFKSAVLQKVMPGLKLDARAIYELKPGSQALQSLNNLPPLNVPVVLVTSVNRENQGKVLAGRLLVFGILPIPSVVGVNTLPVAQYLNNWATNYRDEITDGVVPLHSQFIYQYCPVDRADNPKYFLTDREHTDVLHDTKYAIAALDALLASLSIQKVQKPTLEGSRNIGFVFDVSGSMAQSDPQNIRKKATSEILNYLQGNENLFLVAFNHQASWMNPQTFNRWTPTEINKLLDQLNASGGTDIGGGLTQMQMAVENNWPENAPGGILLFSDGMGGFNEEHRWFLNRGIPIHTISYKNLGNAATLSRIAAETGGVYVAATNEQDVIDALFGFLTEVSNRDNLFSATQELKPGQRIEQSFNIDQNADEALINARWQGNGQVKIIVTDPKGKKYVTGANGTWHLGNNQQSVQIDKPEGGKWSLLAEAESGNTSALLITTEVTASTPTQARVRMLPEQQVPTFALAVNDNTPKQSVIPTMLTVETPSGRKYSQKTQFTNGTLSIVPTEGNGNYRASMSFSLADEKNNTIYRQINRGFYVGDASAAFIAPVSSISGARLNTNLGRMVGNREGTPCTIQDNAGNIKANGRVTYVNDTSCEVVVLEYLGRYHEVLTTDLVVLDQESWQRD